MLMVISFKVTSTISALIGCHFNKVAQCCEGTFDEALLTKAKKCTAEQNKRYCNK